MSWSKKSLRQNKRWRPKRRSNGFRLPWAARSELWKSNILHCLMEEEERILNIVAQEVDKMKNGISFDPELASCPNEWPPPSGWVLRMDGEDVSAALTTLELSKAFSDHSVAWATSNPKALGHSFEFGDLFWKSAHGVMFSPRGSIKTALYGTPEYWELRRTTPKDEMFEVSSITDIQRYLESPKGIAVAGTIGRPVVESLLKYIPEEKKCTE